MKKSSKGAFAFWLAASILIILVGFFGKYIAPYDPLEQDIFSIDLGPCREHLLGTDSLGRDMLSRIICGTGTSVFSTFVIIALNTVIGCTLGITAALAGGVADKIIMKLVTIFQAFPGTVLAIAVASILGNGIENAALALVVVGWPESTRISRSMTLKIKDASYLKVAKLYGCGTGSLILRHIFPNIRSLIIVNATLSISGTMLSMASLSFLGLSAQPPTPEWGYMLNEGRLVFLSSPGRVLFPGLAIFLVVVVFSRLGDHIEQLLLAGPATHSEDNRPGFWSTVNIKLGGRKMKRTSALILALVMIVSLFAGCAAKTEPPVETAASDAAPVAAVDKHLNVAFKSAVEKIDPGDAGNWTATRIGVGERLFMLDDDMNVQPWLATSYENIDNLTWKITLRDGVKFSNGKEMTGDAVKACLERTMSMSTEVASLLDIADIAVDGQVLTITTNSPNAGLPASMCHYGGTIMDADELDDKGIYASGTGPYVVTNWVKDEKLELKANENYWGEPAKIGSITVYFYPDGNAMAMALQNGDVDLTFQMPSENMFNFQNIDGFTVYGQAGSRSQMLTFNYKNALLSDINVRKAICMCIDKVSYAEQLNKGSSVPATGLYPATFSYGDVEGISYDPEGAAKLLADAGYADSNGDGTLDKNGQELSFRLYTYGAHGALLPTYGEAVQAALKEQGIGIDLQLMDYSQQDALMKAGDYDLAINSWIQATTGDPTYWCNMQFKSTGDYNYGGYSNAEVDALVDEMNLCFDRSGREELAREIQKLIIADCGLYTFGHLVYTVVANNKVSGINYNPTEFYWLTGDLDINE